METTHTYTHTLAHITQQSIEFKEENAAFSTQREKTHAREVVLSLSSFLYYIINQLINTPAEDVTQDTP